jgi:hypothetical protein
MAPLIIDTFLAYVSGSTYLTSSRYLTGTH